MEGKKMADKQEGIVSGREPAYEHHGGYPRPGGSGIHIKESHKGLFTAKATAHGESVQEYAADVLKPGSGASPETKKQANFARNAAHFNHSGSGGRSRSRSK
jgi:hypothetical protein